MLGLWDHGYEPLHGASGVLAINIRLLRGRFPEMSWPSHLCEAGFPLFSMVHLPWPLQGCLYLEPQTFALGTLGGGTQLQDLFLSDALLHLHDLGQIPHLVF